MSKHSPSARLQNRRLILALAAACIPIGMIQAQSGTWISTASTSWTEPTAWSGGNIADGAENVANFNSVDLPAGVLTIDVVSSRTIGQLIFGDTDTSTAGTWNVGSLVTASTQTLTLSHLTAPQVTTNVNTTVNTLFAAANGFTKFGAGQLQFNQINAGLAGTITVEAGTLAVGQNGSGSGSGNINGTIGTASVLLKDGAGFAMNSAAGKNFPGNGLSIASNATAYLNSVSLTNGFNGAISGDSSGTLTIGGTSGVNLGASNVRQFSGFSGTVNVPATATMSYRGTISGTGNGGDSTNFLVNGNLNTRNAGTVSLGALNGSGTLSGNGTAGGTNVVNYVVGLKGVDSTFSGTIQNSGSGVAAVLKTGAATFTMAGSMTSNGTVTVNQGVMKFTGTKSGTGAVTVASGGTLMGTSSVAGTTTVNSGGKLAPGDGAVNSGVGNFTLNALTLAPGSLLDLEFGSGNDSVTVSSANGLTLNGGALNLFQAGTSSVFSNNGEYTILNYNGTLGGSIANLSVAAASQISGKNYQFLNTGSAIQLKISDLTSAVFWNVDSNGTWSTGSNWTGGTAPDGAGKIANFGGGGTPITSNRTVFLTGTQTVGTVSFDNPSFSYTLDTTGGGILRADNSGATTFINVVNGSHVVNVPVQLTGPAHTVNVSNGVDQLTVNGVISGPSDLAKSGNGSLILTAPNIYTGNTAVSGGTLVLSGGDNRLPVTTGLTVNASTVNLNGNNQAVVSLNGDGGVTNSGAAAILTVNGGGAFSGALSGATGLVKNDTASTLNLTGPNTNTGSITVNGGTLAYGNGTNIAPAQTINISGGSTLNIGAGSGATVDVLNATGNAILTSSLNANSSHTLGINSISIASDSTLTMTNNARTNLGGTNVGQGATGAGTLIVNVPATVSGTDGRYYIRGDWSTFTGTLNAVGTSATSILNIQQNGGAFSSLSQARIDLSSSVPGTNKIALVGRFSTNGAIGIGALTGTADATLRPEGGAGNGGRFQVGALGISTTYAGAITDTGGTSVGLEKVGAGTLTHAGTSSYTGATTVTAGTLVLGPQASGVVVTGLAGGILNGGKLIIDYTGGSSPKPTLVDDPTLGIAANAPVGNLSGQLRTTLPFDTTKAIGWLDDGTSTFQARYTYKGDVDLSATVDSVDFNAFVGTYGKTAGAIWADGDFDFDGKVNTIDFNHLAGNFGLAPLGGAVAAPSLGSVVPEPSTLAVLAIAGAALLTRRVRSVR